MTKLKSDILNGCGSGGGVVVVEFDESSKLFDTTTFPFVGLQSVERRVLVLDSLYFMQARIIANNTTQRSYYSSSRPLYSIGDDEESTRCEFGRNWSSKMAAQRNRKCRESHIIWLGFYIIYRSYKQLLLVTVLCRPTATNEPATLL